MEPSVWNYHLKTLPYFFFLFGLLYFYSQYRNLHIFFWFVSYGLFCEHCEQWKQTVLKHYLLYLPKFTLQFKKVLLLNVCYFLWLHNPSKFWLELWKPWWWTSTVVQCIGDLTSKNHPKFSRLSSLIKLNSSQHCCSSTSQEVKNTKLFIQSEFFQ